MLRKPLLIATLLATPILAWAATTAAPATPGVGPCALQADITKADFLKQAQEHFALMDANKDGKVTLEERRAARQGQGRGMACTQQDLTKAEFLKQAEAHFALMDTNKDGKITADERQSRRGPGMRGGRQGQGMGRMGASMPAEITQADHLKWAETRFDQMDTNKDGTVTTAERQAARGHMMGQRGHGRMGSTPASK